MKQMFLSVNNQLNEIETFEPGAWINLVNPSQENLFALLKNSRLIY